MLFSAKNIIAKMRSKSLTHTVTHTGNKAAPEVSGAARTFGVEFYRAWVRTLPSFSAASSCIRSVAWA